MYKKILFIISVFFTCSIFASQEGISLDTTRVVFDSENDSVSFSVRNTSPNMVFLLKATIGDYFTDDNKVPFFITPPLNRIDANNNVQFRINKLDSATALPKDRESLFAINVLAIPPKKDNSKDDSLVQIGLNTRIKLIFRPHEINNKSSIDNLPEKLSFTKHADGIEIKNPTPYFITIGQISFNGLPTKDFVMMLKPFSGTIVHERNVKTISFSIINDYGANSIIRNVTL
ncbi:molecular chaperone [Escherichia coli]|uniref:fimbrial biogenesis chaperone n=1 Tax=Escherichia coli TaxID=562 RepID=UPI000BE5D566|nr:molecular chaperone [Escherichia coli]EEY7535396.1 molecular chaperone [Escherichia coli]EFE9120310.1 molecular chaperone [Escherichia coli]EGU0173647.1 molecular chaperone [Escherichia coli]ELJ9861396.1 molecular chaperone [Escherichia coli]ELO7644854.1 molecular chaperone [Escherichia coli]